MAETAGAFVQVVPLLVVYCQVPLAVSKAVMAMPWDALALGSVIFVPPRLAMRVEINVPVLALSFWFWGLRVGVPELSRAGELLTRTVTVVGVETMPSVAVY
ncbi:hypothetical protein E5S67_05690 [Microcoleus sp. IPMA8]|uniref:Uncharacterized protein n=1 Tax=Microcoleus asticus IPMA8 TaxID=2563858 RepID=A0ABX2D5J7_9CYAN|nr:hypothetical protein [Microcoleus asticus IPMA8]